MLHRAHRGSVPASAVEGMELGIAIRCIFQSSRIGGIYQIGVIFPFRSKINGYSNILYSSSLFEI